MLLLAAGQGTRMKSKHPKLLFKVAGRTMLEHSIITSLDLNPDLLAVVVRSKSDEIAKQVYNFRDTTKTEISLCLQSGAEGTGSAVQCGLEQVRKKIGDDFDLMVIAADNALITTELLQKLIKEHFTSKSDATAFSTVLDDPKGYGRIVRNADGSFKQIVEQKDANESQKAIKEVNVSLYIFNAKKLSETIKTLSTNNQQNELYLTDCLEKMSTVIIPQTDSVLLMSINDRAQLAELSNELNKRICRELQLNGVTIVDPKSTWIDRGTVFESDCTILPGSYIGIGSKISEDAVIGPNTQIIDSTIGKNAVVDSSKVVGAKIADDATIGPFTYIRPETVVGEKAKVGAFVEMKKSVVGKKSKVPHLSYVGDTKIGQNSNLGAGTIIANYDGVKKHNTTIGDDVFIGSDTVVVAPRAIGSNAKTGAGTVLIKDVEDGQTVISENTNRIISKKIIDKKR